MYRPFELLKLLRDSKVIPAEILEVYSTAHESIRICNALRRLVDAGVLHQDGSELHLDNVVTDLFHSLELSLSALAPYTNETVLTSPTFRPPKNPSPASTLFVAMPFSNELQPVYEDHILSVAKKIDITCTRGDEIFGTDAIISDIWYSIANATILIADCTGRNPNVFYEIGIAHVIGKPVILITQSVDDAPFDVRHLRLIEYAYTPRGMKIFDKDLKNQIERVLSTSGIDEYHDTYVHQIIERANR